MSNRKINASPNGTPNKIDMRRLYKDFNSSDTLKSMPSQFIKEIILWNEVYLSPYKNSWSFYNKPKTKDITIPETKRLSDHWNFIDKVGKAHCITDIDVNNNSHWSLGVYNEHLKLYEIVKTYPQSKRSNNDWIDMRDSIFGNHREKSKKESIEIQKKVNEHKISVDFEYDGIRLFGKLIKLRGNLIIVETKNDIIPLEAKNYSTSQWKKLRSVLHKSIQEI